MTVEQILHKIYREESGKIISVLTKLFGPAHLELAEDVVQDAFIEAIEKWGNHLPDNPKGWIYTAAKNKAINAVKRDGHLQKYQSEMAHFLTSEWTANAALEQLFSAEKIEDELLRMMFTCAHPALNPDAQTALILKTLCGFGIPEIAKAYFSTTDTINKRLVRARKKLKEVNHKFELPPSSELDQRLSNVLNAIYLLFNEGYSASSGDKIIKWELCLESIRLVELIVASPLLSNKCEAHSLLALMKLNASRFISRLSEDRQFITMQEQDRSKWDQTLISSGISNLNAAMKENTVNKYFIMAAISANHCTAPTFESTSWSNILDLYDQLLTFENSPIVQLNRAVAISWIHGNQKAIDLLEYLKEEDHLKKYHRLYSTLGDLYLAIQQKDKAINNFKIAESLANIDSEKNWIQSKIKKCK